MKASLIALATLSLASASLAEPGSGFSGQRASADKRAPAAHGELLDDFDLAGRGMPQILPMDSLKLGKRETAAEKEKAALKLASSKKAAAAATKAKLAAASKSKSISLSKAKASSLKKKSVARTTTTTHHTTATTKPNTAAAAKYTTSSRAAYSSSSKAHSLAAYSSSSAAAARRVAASGAALAAAQQAGAAYTTSSRAAASSAARFTTSSRAAYSSSSLSAASAASSSAAALLSKKAYSASSKAASASLAASKVSYSASSAFAAASAVASAYVSTIAQIADGSYMQAGAVNATFLWQASGILSHNGCPQYVNITDCFGSYLNADGMWEETAKPSSRLMVRDVADADAGSDGSSSSSSKAPAPASSSQSPAASTSKTTTTTSSKPKTTTTPTTTTTTKASSSTTKPAAAQTTPASTKVKVVGSSSSAPAASSSAGSGSGSSSTSPAAAASPSPNRQRNELYSWPPAAAGTTWQYNWKSFQDNSTTSSGTFFHQWQLFSRASDGPVVALNIQHGGVSIYDYVRNCENGVGVAGCPAAVPLAQFVGRTIQHSMLVTYGLTAGSMSYQAWDTTSNSTQPLIDYEVTGNLGAQGSLKMGNYRIGFNGMQPASAWFGDYTAQQLLAGTTATASPIATGWTTATTTSTSYPDAMATDDSGDYRRRRFARSM